MPSQGIVVSLPAETNQGDVRLCSHFNTCAVSFSAKAIFKHDFLTPFKEIHLVLKKRGWGGVEDSVSVFMAAVYSLIHKHKDKMRFF